MTLIEKIMGYISAENQPRDQPRDQPQYQDKHFGPKKDSENRKLQCILCYDEVKINEKHFCLMRN